MTSGITVPLTCPVVTLTPPVNAGLNGKKLVRLPLSKRTVTCGPPPAPAPKAAVMVVAGRQRISRCSTWGAYRAVGACLRRPPRPRERIRSCRHAVRFHNIFMVQLGEGAKNHRE